jgi:hypothetical protein
MILLPALLLLAPSAQDLVPGFQLDEAPYPGGASIRELTNGALVTSNGADIKIFTPSGAPIGTLGAFATPGKTGAMVVDPTETFLLIGEANSGELLRVDLGGAGQTTLGFLPGNTDATFDAGGRAIVSARPCGSGPECGVSLVRLDTATGAMEAVAAMEGAPGPVAFDAPGGLVYGTRADGPLLPGESDLLRIAAADLAAPPPPAFQPSGNLVVIEIESAPPVGNWNEYTALTGFTGDSYYRWDGPDLFGSPGSDVLRYEFEVLETANYKMRIHNRHEDPAADQDNDCWVRVDGGPWYKVFSNEGSATVAKWNWHSIIEETTTIKYDANYDLAAGRHVLEVSGRSNGYSADRVVFYQVDVWHALDLSNPESIFAPFNALDATTLAAGVTGPSELVLEPDTGALFLAEYVQNLGVNRIRRITAQGAVEPFVDGVPFQQLRNLGFHAGPGPAAFLPYQPAGPDVLTFTRNDPGVESERFDATSQRPFLRLAGPGTVTGIGAVALTLDHAPAFGYAVVGVAPSSAILPSEVAVGLPPLFVGLNPLWLTLLPTPLACDPSGHATLTFLYGGGAPGLAGLQALVLGPGGAVVGTSNVAEL